MTTEDSSEESFGGRGDGLGREGARETRKDPCESSIGWRELTPWTLKRTMGTNPQELRAPKEIQEGSEQKDFPLELQDSFLHTCSESENWRKRRALMPFFVPSTCWLQGLRATLCGLDDKIRAGPPGGKSLQGQGRAG